VQRLEPCQSRRRLPEISARARAHTHTHITHILYAKNTETYADEEGGDGDVVLVHFEVLQLRQQTDLPAALRYNNSRDAEQAL
jgi:hypothetical protein